MHDFPSKLTQKGSFEHRRSQIGEVLQRSRSEGLATSIPISVRGLGNCDVSIVVLEYGGIEIRIWDGNIGHGGWDNRANRASIYIVINEMRCDQHSALSKYGNFYVALIDSSNSYPVLRLVVQRWEFREGFCLYCRDNGEIPY